MTRNQKISRINHLKKILHEFGFTIDSYGNFKKTCNDFVYRAKIMQINLRFERRLEGAGSRWYKIFSKPLVRIEPSKFYNYISKLEWKRF